MASVKQQLQINLELLNLPDAVSNNLEKILYALFTELDPSLVDYFSSCYPITTLLHKRNFRILAIKHLKQISTATTTSPAEISFPFHVRNSLFDEDRIFAVFLLLSNMVLENRIKAINMNLDEPVNDLNCDVSDLKDKLECEKRFYKDQEAEWRSMADHLVSELDKVDQDLVLIKAKKSSLPPMQSFQSTYKGILSFNSRISTFRSTHLKTFNASLESYEINPGITSLPSTLYKSGVLDLCAVLKEYSNMITGISSTVMSKSQRGQNLGLVKLRERVEVESEKLMKMEKVRVDLENVCRGVVCKVRERMKGWDDSGAVKVTTIQLDVIDWNADVSEIELEECDPIIVEIDTEINTNLEAHETKTPIAKISSKPKKNAKSVTKKILESFTNNIIQELNTSPSTQSNNSQDSPSKIDQFFDEMDVYGYSGFKTRAQLPRTPDHVRKSVNHTDPDPPIKVDSEHQNMDEWSTENEIINLESDLHDDNESSPVFDYSPKQFTLDANAYEITPVPVVDTVQKREPVYFGDGESILYGNEAAGDIWNETIPLFDGGDPTMAFNSSFLSNGSLADGNTPQRIVHRTSHVLKSAEKSIVGEETPQFSLKTDQKAEEQMWLLSSDVYDSKQSHLINFDPPSKSESESEHSTSSHTPPAENEPEPNPSPLTEREPSKLGTDFQEAIKLLHKTSFSHLRYRPVTSSPLKKSQTTSAPSSADNSFEETSTAKCEATKSASVPSPSPVKKFTSPLKIALIRSAKKSEKRRIELKNVQRSERRERRQRKVSAERRQNSGDGFLGSGSSSGNEGLVSPVIYSHDDTGVKKKSSSKKSKNRGNGVSGGNGVVSFSSTISPKKTTFLERLKSIPVHSSNTIVLQPSIFSAQPEELAVNEVGDDREEAEQKSVVFEDDDVNEYSIDEFGESVQLETNSVFSDYSENGAGSAVDDSIDLYSSKASDAESSPLNQQNGSTSHHFNLFSPYVPPTANAKKSLLNIPKTIPNTPVTFNFTMSSKTPAWVKKANNNGYTNETPNKIEMSEGEISWMENQDVDVNDLLEFNDDLLVAGDDGSVWSEEENNRSVLNYEDVSLLS